MKEPIATWSEVYAKSYYELWASGSTGGEPPSSGVEELQDKSSKDYIAGQNNGLIIGLTMGLSENPKPTVNDAVNGWIVKGGYKPIPRAIRTFYGDVCLMGTAFLTNVTAPPPNPYPAHAFMKLAPSLCGGTYYRVPDIVRRFSGETYEIQPEYVGGQ